MKNFLDYLYKVNFSHGIYINLKLRSVDAEGNLHRYKVYVSKGNNSLLIKELFKRRFWYEVVGSFEECQIYWSQSRLEGVTSQQRKMRKLDKKSEKKEEAEVQSLDQQFLFRK